MALKIWQKQLAFSAQTCT